MKLFVVCSNQNRLNEAILMSTLKILFLYRNTSLYYPHVLPDRMLWSILELRMSRTNFHGPNEIRANEVRLYLVIIKGTATSENVLCDMCA